MEAADGGLVLRKRGGEPAITPANIELARASESTQYSCVDRGASGAVALRRSRPRVVTVYGAAAERGGTATEIDPEKATKQLLMLTVGLTGRRT